MVSRPGVRRSGGASTYCRRALTLPASRYILKNVSPLESIVEDLKVLPPAKLGVAADFVHRLKEISEEERQAIFTRTAGALSPEEAAEMERVIEEGCGQIDERGW